MSMFEVDFVLVGPRSGQTVTLAGYRFVRGVCKLIGSEKDLAGPTNILGKFHNAFPRGSKDYEHAVARWEFESQRRRGQGASKGATDGKRDADKGPVDRPAEQVHSEPGPVGEEPPAPAAADGGVDVGALDGGPGPVPDGDGHGDAGVRPVEGSGDAGDEVLEALKQLDPQNEDHWTAIGGKPSISAVSSIMGRNVTRTELDTGFPDFDRGSVASASAPAAG